MQVLKIAICMFRLIILVGQKMKNILYKYKNSIIAFYAYILILFVSFITVCFFSLDFESGDENILAIIISLIYFFSGFFLLRKEEKEKLFISLIPFLIYLMLISILAPISGFLSMLLLFTNIQGLLLVDYVEILFDINFEYGMTCIIISPCPVICLYLGGIVKHIFTLCGICIKS